ncbi:Spo0E like sporulation regulatory protein [compost metagenome]
MSNLRDQIEKKRKEMTRLANRYGLLDKRVLAKSQELDRLINDYERMKNQLKGKRESRLLRVESAAV